MPRTDGRIEKGQSLRSAISARAWNRAQDAADIVLGTTSEIVADGLRLPLVPQVITYAAHPAQGPTPLVGEPVYITAGTLSASEVVPYTTEAPTEVERRMFGSGGPQTLLSASRSFSTSPVTPMVGICIDPVKKLYCIRGIVPVRIMSPTKTATAELAGSLRSAVIYSDGTRAYARLVSAGGFRVVPATPLPAAGNQAALPSQGWGIAML